MTTATIIDHRDVVREYGLAGTEAVIDHPVHGRIYIADGFGGVGTIEGGTVRWAHGIVCQLHPEDTLAILDGQYNETVTTLAAMTGGYDESRPVLEWDGSMIEGVARSAGLA